jgi:hypothetical protein
VIPQILISVIVRLSGLSGLLPITFSLVACPLYP